MKKTKYRKIKELLDKYDAFEVQPCCETGHVNDDGRRCVEVCEPEEAQFWTVYGHISGQGVEALADCLTKEIAELIELALDFTVKGKRS